MIDAGKAHVVAPSSSSSRFLHLAAQQAGFGGGGGRCSCSAYSVASSSPITLVVEERFAAILLVLVVVVLVVVFGTDLVEVNVEPPEFGCAPRFARVVVHGDDCEPGTEQIGDDVSDLERLVRQQGLDELGPDPPDEGEPEERDEFVPVPPKGDPPRVLLDDPTAVKEGGGDSEADKVEELVGPRDGGRGEVTREGWMEPEHGEDEQGEEGAEDQGGADPEGEMGESERAERPASEVTDAADLLEPVP